MCWRMFATPSIKGLCYSNRSNKSDTPYIVTMENDTRTACRRDATLINPPFFLCTSLSKRYLLPWSRALFLRRHRKLRLPNSSTTETEPWRFEKCICRKMYSRCLKFFCLPAKKEKERPGKKKKRKKKLLFLSLLPLFAPVVLRVFIDVLFSFSLV
ncbi:hypothetical protein BDB00DRAFT_565818 [Zychaea mexicana]|uniref:uncharacterized protein n=1 Tax=Zychaea mexicana TaxID=64656 RepID=UPI0022FDB68E|nr:uncharacterized protein BDB00DRAFT_565818 [Zychaea mexicana]KAI9490149.1 hypothetical protein BDB00DRAFT_565818 [Zychaea mexicana]